MKFQPFLSCVGLCIFLSIPANGVKIEFYRYENYTELMLQSRSTANCNDIIYHGNFPRGIITDTCVMVYYYQGCNSRSKKILPGKGIHPGLESFHVCTAEEGGPQLNVDITKLYVEQEQAPEILESYKTLCGCVNVPQYVQNMANWSINNHGNDLLAYFEPDCSDTKFSPLFLTAGNSEDSWGIYRKNIQDGNKVYKIQSFGPVLYSTYSDSCLPHMLRNQIQALQTNIESLKDQLETQKREISEELRQSYNRSKAEFDNYRISVERKFEQLAENLTMLNYAQTNDKHDINDKLDKVKEDLKYIEDRVGENI